MGGIQGHECNYRDEKLGALHGTEDQDESEGGYNLFHKGEIT